MLKADRSAPAKVSLPDDDAEAIESLCCALHHQNLECMTADSESILRFAIAVDKYQCTAAVAPATLTLFNALDPSPQENANLMKAIFLLDDPKDFQVYTSMLIKCHQHEGIEESELMPGMEGLQSAFLFVADRSYKLILYLGALCQREQDAAKHMSQKIERMVDCILPALIRRHVADPRGNNSEEDDEYLCDYDQRAAARYLELITASRMWPGAKRDWKSLNHLLINIHTLEIPKLHDVQKCGTEWADDGERFHQRIDPEIENLKDSAEMLWAGLCLDCFKAKGAPHGPCRVPHDEFASEDIQMWELLHRMHLHVEGDDE